MFLTYGPIYFFIFTFYKCFRAWLLILCIHATSGNVTSNLRWCFFFLFRYRKATKYYQQDLCFNPERFDSWAGVALARASKLEQKLNAVSNHFILHLTIFCQSCVTFWNISWPVIVFLSIYNICKIVYVVLQFPSFQI